MTGKRELADLVSYVFQTLSRRRISEEEWVRVISFERNWVPPSRAKRLAADARSLGLLRNAGEHDFEIGLEAEGLPLPVDYRPALGALEVPGAGSRPGDPPVLPLFRRVVQALAQSLGQSESEVVGRINATQEAVGRLLMAEVAALYYGALHGVDLARFYDEVEASLTKAHVQT